ncbi:F0F1 ATP synthase subunit delta [Paenibacillus sp. GCM10023252]|uniref:F0F1 ATP synthase subunit delta n=1 Tax=Paenibacillus sp. GCM10023252 TaxID=3252649 RepID=UPI003607F162
MSRDAVVAKRYAKALFDIAQGQSLVNEIEAQLKLIVSAIEENKDLGRFLASPSIGTEQKIALLRGAFGDQISVILNNTLELLVTRGRLDILSDIAETFTKIAGEALGQAQATVYTAQLLTDSELSDVAAQFGAISGKKILAQQVVEPSLLGGIQVRIGNRLYDGSLSGKLSRLEKSLKSLAL